MSEEPTCKRQRISDDIEEEHGGPKDTIGFFFKYTPKKQDTGVDEAITRLAAAMSGQLYSIQKELEEFDLSKANLEVKNVLIDDHGAFRVTNPLFGVVISGSTMLIGWRGTTGDIMNILTDVNVTPATSSRWAHISTGIQVHGGFHPIAENDLCRHECTIIGLMEEHAVTNLITTGHSLGGAIANVAHLAIQGELTKEKSIWKDYADKLKSQGKEFNARCIAFSAPSSIFNVSEPDNATVNDFLKKIEAYSCNIIYSTDPVPRLPTFMGFINDLVEELIPEVKDDIRKRIGFLGRLGSNFINVDANDIFEGMKKSQSELFKAVSISRHYCKIIYYENDAAEPIVLKDYGYNIENGSPDGIKNFRDIKWEETPNVIASVNHNHTLTVRGPGLGYNIPEEKIIAKLYTMHNRSLLENDPDVAKVPVDGWEDCKKKAKEHFIYAFMGGYVDWEDEPKEKDAHERKGILHVKANVAKASNDAGWVKDRGIFRSKEVKHSALWRTPALADKVELAEKAKKGAK